MIVAEEPVIAVAAIELMMGAVEAGVVGVVGVVGADPAPQVRIVIEKGGRVRPVAPLKLARL